MKTNSNPKLSILLLCDNNPKHANTILDHIAAFLNFSRHDILLFNPLGLRESWFLNLGEFDVVVIHYSLAVIYDHYLSPDIRNKIKNFSGLKIQFIQDDYRQVDQYAEAMRFLGIHVLFTLYPQDKIPCVWDERRLPGVVKINSLAGYVPDNLIGLSVPPLDERPIDVGYRGRTVPYWLGKLSQEKAWIGEGFLERAGPFGLKCDIAWREHDRIYGQDWPKFISSCKAMLGTESGASITDLDGSVEKATKEYLAQHPQADFWEVYKSVLEPYEGNVPINVVSPRVFECAALRTAMVLFPGRYSHVLQPWVHYIPLAKDFSNMAEVVENLRDTEFLRNMTERAYTDLITSGRYSYRAFIDEFDEVVCQYGKPHGRLFKPNYWLAKLEKGVRIPTISSVHVDLFLKFALALWLTLSNKGLRLLFWKYLWSRDLQKKAALHRLLEDFLRLVIIWQAQTGNLTAGEPFRVSVRYDPDTQWLILTSWRINSDNPSEVACQSAHKTTLLRKNLWPTICAKLRAQEVKAIIWEHISEIVPYALSRSLWLVFNTWRPKYYTFDPLLEIAHQFPNLTLDVLLPLLSGEPPRWRLPGLALNSLPQMIVRLYLTLKVILSDSNLRHLWWQYAKDNRLCQSIAPNQIWRDLLMLGILRHAKVNSETISPCLSILAQWDSSVGQLTLSTQTCPTEALILVQHNQPANTVKPIDWPALKEKLQAGRINSILWSHSVPHETIRYSVIPQKRIAVCVTEEKPYHFPSLLELGERFPGPVLSILSSIIQGD